MAHMIFCDVCEKPFSIKEWTASPGIEATIPPALLGDLEVDSDDYTFCSWQCLARLAFRYTSEGSDGQEEDDLLTEDDVEQEEEEKPARKPNKVRKPAEPEVPPTGVYFPEGMKVDGRPAGQLRRQ